MRRAGWRFFPFKRSSWSAAASTLRLADQRNIERYSVEIIADEFTFLTRA